MKYIISFRSEVVSNNQNVVIRYVNMYGINCPYICCWIAAMTWQTYKSKSEFYNNLKICFVYLPVLLSISLFVQFKQYTSRLSWVILGQRPFSWLHSGIRKYHFISFQTLKVLNRLKALIGTTVCVVSSSKEKFVIVTWYQGSIQKLVHILYISSFYFIFYSKHLLYSSIEICMSVSFGDLNLYWYWPTLHLCNPLQLPW